MKKSHSQRERTMENLPPPTPRKRPLSPAVLRGKGFRQDTAKKRLLFPGEPREKSDNEEELVWEEDIFGNPTPILPQYRSRSLSDIEREIEEERKELSDACGYACAPHFTRIGFLEAYKRKNFF